MEAEDAEPDIHYGTAAPTESGDGDLWVDTTNMRLLMRVNGAWVNPDRQESVVDLSPYQKIVSPPGRKFKKANATTLRLVVIYLLRNKWASKISSIVGCRGY